MDKYSKEDIAGQGTYGVVYKATEKATTNKVAIKKLRIQKAEDGVGFSAYREIKMLQELKHPNIVGLLDVFAHNANVYLVFEFLDWDLEKVIKDKSKILHPPDIKCYMKQLLEGVEYCHKNWVLHRDLKPNNLLLGPQGILKLGDFGLARAYGSPNNIFTTEVITRWYRPPELLFGAKSYCDAVDMWSVGCIFAELMLRTPYLPGDSDIDQLSKIFSALGTPDEETWPGVTSLPDYVPFNYCPPTSYRSLFTAASDDAVDLLSKLLKFNPLERITAAEALQHPYFSNQPPPTPPHLLPHPTVTKSSTFSDKEIEALLRASPNTIKQDLKNNYNTTFRAASIEGTPRSRLQFDDNGDGNKIKRKLDMDMLVD